MLYSTDTKRKFSKVQAALVICGLFICNFAYMRSGNGLFPGTYPLIYSHPWSFYMQIHYMRAYFWSPYLSHITRSNCTVFPKKQFLDDYIVGKTNQQMFLKQIQSCRTNREKFRKIYVTMLNLPH
jgi:hypothetical protein